VTAAASKQLLKRHGKCGIDRPVPELWQLSVGYTENVRCQAVGIERGIFDLALCQQFSGSNNLLSYRG